MFAWLDSAHTPLPPTREAMGPASDAPGLLAAGGDLGLARLTEAYSHGVFPWFSQGQPVLWWSPDPRMVLPVKQFHLTRSLRRSIARFLSTPGCELRMDSALPQVLQACAQTPREGQDGSWIVPAMVQAYEAWHRAGVVHSVETWVDDVLVGGLYCVNLGGMVFGESMFAHRSDASKIALAALVAFCRHHDVAWIDCQQNTRHLASLGAHEVSRAAFEQHLRTALARPAPAPWAYDAALWPLLDARLAAPAGGNDRGPPSCDVHRDT